ncbi:MAG TPA: hypothetical protein VGC42_04575 [Kofleriaceae bacterium]
MSLRGAIPAILITLGACSPRTGPRGASASDAVLLIRSNVRDAQVYLDGKFVAGLDALRGGIAIEPGVHRLELRRDDYFSRYLEISVSRAERKPISLDLSAILP